MQEVILFLTTVCRDVDPYHFNTDTSILQSQPLNLSCSNAARVLKSDLEFSNFAGRMNLELLESFGQNYPEEFDGSLDCISMAVICQFNRLVG